MDPWTRDQATVKLVGRRKAMLEKVAARFAPGCSPVEAIDRALEIALAPSEDSDLVSLTELVMVVDDARRADAARIESAIAKLSAQLRGLHALIEEVARADES